MGGERLASQPPYPPRSSLLGWERTSRRWAILFQTPGFLLGRFTGKVLQARCGHCLCHLRPSLPSYALLCFPDLTAQFPAQWVYRETPLEDQSVRTGEKQEYISPYPSLSISSSCCVFCWLWFQWITFPPWSPLPWAIPAVGTPWSRWNFSTLCHTCYPFPY